MLKRGIDGNQLNACLVQRSLNARSSIHVTPLNKQRSTTVPFFIYFFIEFYVHFLWFEINREAVNAATASSSADGRHYNVLTKYRLPCGVCVCTPFNANYFFRFLFRAWDDQRCCCGCHCSECGGSRVIVLHKYTTSYLCVFDVVLAQRQYYEDVLTHRDVTVSRVRVHRSVVDIAFEKNIRIQKKTNILLFCIS